MMSAVHQIQVTGLTTVVDGDSTATQVAATKVEFYRVKLVQDEDGRFVATVLELQGVISDGATKDEAMANVHEAIEAMLESMGQQKVFMLIATE